jgi:hypothetical protein
LPAEIRELHDIDGVGQFSGRASVIPGRSPLAKLIGRVVGFPGGAGDIPLQVEIKSVNGREHWSRDFDGHEFSSVMTIGSGRFSNLVCERFGPANFAMALLWENGRLNYLPRGWTFLGIPMPRFLAPQGKTYEYVADGKFHFHVKVTLPIIGHVVTYKGWLSPLSQTALPEPRAAHV